MAIFSKLTRAQYDDWKKRAMHPRKTGAVTPNLGEKFIADNFPGHVDHRLTGVSATDQERIIMENYVMPKEDT